MRRNKILYVALCVSALTLTVLLVRISSDRTPPPVVPKTATDAAGAPARTTDAMPSDLHRIALSTESRDETLPNASSRPPGLSPLAPPSLPPELSASVDAQPAFTAVGPNTVGIHVLPPPSSLPPGVTRTASPFSAAAARVASAIAELRSAGPNTAERRLGLLTSEDPTDQIAGLAASAFGLDAIDLGSYDDAVVFAAAYAASDAYGTEAGDNILSHWILAQGVDGAAARARELLLGDALRYGGGSAALAVLTRASDPSALGEDLASVSQNTGLDHAARTKALVLLRESLPFEDYQASLRRIDAESRAADDGWATSAERQLERVEGPPPIMSGPVSLDATLVAVSFSRPYENMVRDFALYLGGQHEAGRLNVTDDGLLALREQIKRLSQIPLSADEQAARTALDRLADGLATELAASGPTEN